jgi:hypothetical protein
MEPDLEPWDSETPERKDGRPSELVLAVRLLAASAALKAFQILEIVITHGDEVLSNPAGLANLGGFVIWILLIVFLWRGNAFARTLVLVAMAWDMIGAFSAASIVYAIGGSQLLASLPWLNVAIEFGAGCLLLQSDCLEWFRKR